MSGSSSSSPQPGPGPHPRHHQHPHHLPQAPSLLSPPSRTRFGPEEFCLVLLRRMADYQPDLVDDARHDLGASRTRMREVNARWQRMRHAGRGAPWPYSRVLGPGQRRSLTFGDLTCQATAWPLPLWPQLRFEVIRGPGGTPLQEWLVRPPGAAPPNLPDDPALLSPWSCVVADLAPRYPGVRQAEGSAPSRWGAQLTDTHGRRLRVDFVWGLLQRVSPW